ncbi:MAG: hypothetical protein ACKN9D_04015, partial [Actinomycetales bacterium]
SPSGSVAGAGGVPALPRVSYRAEGHAFTVVLRPGPGSSVPVVEYLLTVTPRDVMPQPGGGYTECAVAGAGAVETSCVLYAQRGDWDVYVAAANDAGSSEWVGRSTWTVTSGPCTDEVAAAGACDLLDTGPGGGIIFYDAGTPQSWGRYLEAAPKGWFGRADDPLYQWCDEYQPGYDGLATKVTVGSGKDNTELIIANCGTNSAAGAAAAYRGGGKDDWFLPSKDELAKLYDKRSEAGMSGVFFWSSSQGEYSAVNAWGQFFDDGHQFNDGKDDAVGSVRPVRAF